MEIRDMRQGTWVSAHKAILFSPHIDTSSFKVYCGLAAFAGNYDQRSWPSTQTLATKLNMSKSTVLRSLKNLEDCKLINVERRDGTSSVYTLLDCQEVQPARRKKAQSPHHAFIEYFDKAAKCFRGVKQVKYLPKDMAAVKRTLATGILTQTQLEQLVLYFMADPGIKAKLGPSISVFFSSGVFAGLQNRMKNGETFWRDLDQYAMRFAQWNGRSVTDEQPLAKIGDADMARMIAELKKKVTLPRHEEE